MAPTKTRLAETEAVGEDVQRRFTQAASKTEHSNKKPTEADYRALYERVKKGELTWEQAASEPGMSKGSIWRWFAKFRAESPASAESVAEQTEPEITSERLTEILKGGHIAELDPRQLLSGTEPRRYQRRRFRSQIQLKDLVASIAKLGIIEPMVVRDKSQSNDRQLIVDGFGRADAWIKASEEAGGTSHKPVLVYPNCLLIKCNDKEAALLAFEKNRRRENFDGADRDYSIVMLHEQQHYTFDELAALIELDRTSISHIVHAWQDIPAKARTMLEDRMITTKHATEIAKLKDWPDEQERLTNWLAEETGKPEFKSRKDANYDNGSYDSSGISAGRLSEMVGDVLERKKQAKAIAADLEKMKSAGKIEEAITSEKADALRTQFAKSLHTTNPPTKRTMQEAMKTAGVKLAKPVEATTAETGMKPPSPARFAQDREQPKLKPCLNCEEHYERPDSCLFDLAPDENNKCGAQQPGHPTRIEPHCLVCGGLVIEDLMDKLKVNYTLDTAKNGNDHNCHTMCLIDQLISSGTLDGKCKSCQNDSCQILEIMRDEAQGRSTETPLTVLVKECPEAEKYGDWFHPRPDMTLDEVNKRAKEYVEELKAEALKGSASGGSH